MLHGCICACSVHICAHTHTQREKAKLGGNSKTRSIQRLVVGQTEGNGKILAPEKSISHQICNPFHFSKCIFSNELSVRQHSETDMV